MTATLCSLYLTLFFSSSLTRIANAILIPSNQPIFYILKGFITWCYPFPLTPQHRSLPLYPVSADSALTQVVFAVRRRRYVCTMYVVCMSIQRLHVLFPKPFQASRWYACRLAYAFSHGPLTTCNKICESSFADG